jgi:uncharacterized membrane protein
MNAVSEYPLVRSYLERLRRDANTLPAPRRRELPEEIEEHVREALPPSPSEADIRNVLDRLGDPDAIVAEERVRLGLGDPPTAGTMEWLAVVLILLGGILLPVLGWILGVVLLWSSKVWTRMDKLIGTLVPPGGLAIALYLIAVAGLQPGQSCYSVGNPGQPAVTHCTGGSSTAQTIWFTALDATLFLAAIGTAIFLVRRARQHSR